MREILKRLFTVLAIIGGAIFIPVWVFRLAHFFGLAGEPQYFHLIEQWLIGAMFGLIAFVAVMGTFALVHYIIYGE